MLGAHLSWVAAARHSGTASAHHSWTTTAPHSWITARHSWTVLSTAGSHCPAQAVLQIPACFGSCWPRAQHVRDPQLSRGVPPSPYQGAVGPMLNPMTPGAGSCRAAGCSRAVPREKQLRGGGRGAAWGRPGHGHGLLRMPRPSRGAFPGEPRNLHFKINRPWQPESRCCSSAGLSPGARMKQLKCSFQEAAGTPLYFL